MNTNELRPLVGSQTEVGAALGVTRQTVAKMIADGQLHAVMVGGRPKIRWAEVYALIGLEESA